MKIRALFLILILSIGICVAEEFHTQPQMQAQLQTQAQTQAQIPITQPHQVAFSACTKMFPLNKEKLYYLTLSAITANKFSIDEIQTQNGYIIFSAANNKYLATVAEIDPDNAILKITPCNDIYIFPPGVLIGMFKYIEMNLNADIR